MDKERFISNFIANYVSCVKTSSGCFPEISAADYILLRKQALLEYNPSEDMAVLPDDPVPRTSGRADVPKEDLHGKATEKSAGSTAARTDKREEISELAILRGLGEED